MDGKSAEDIERMIESGELLEIYDPHAFDASLPARLPVRGLDGEFIPGASADVVKTADGKGVSVSLTLGRHAEPPESPMSFAFRFPPGS